jgi:RHH-type proline utilization regulon transcriptional repressor/proline dehydrogenase/delta 1-pyrroline-5-carboxylate dehydrogenase
MRRFVLPLVSDPAYGALAAERSGDEAAQVRRLVAAVGLEPVQRRAIAERAQGWVRPLRAEPGRIGALESLLARYPLDTREGRALLTLAESVLRVPDSDTLDLLIRDRLGGADWQPAAPGGRASPLVETLAWALGLAGRLVERGAGPGLDPGPSGDPAGDGPGPGAPPLLGPLVGPLVGPLARPLVRRALRRAMGLLAGRFAMGRTIDEALARSARGEGSRWRHSFDMLGESARTAADAGRWRGAYLEAIAAVSRASGGAGPIEGPGVSIKLSALHPRFEPAQAERVRCELLPLLLELAQEARAGDIGLTLDAEESERLDLSLDLFAALCAEPSLAGWAGLGIAVQAYQRGALALVGLLGELARRHGRRLAVRLVKGAYWDTEIKRAQQLGLPGYPVFTRKVHTDLSYLACARALLGHSPLLYPQFASHNAHSLAAVLELAGNRPFELQRLHGMGEGLHGLILDESPGVASRVYDPVGRARDLLPYLVRRLLENGANASFVNRLADSRISVAQAAADPLEADQGEGPSGAPIPRPRGLYGLERIAAAGLDPSDPVALARLESAMGLAALRMGGGQWRAAPLISGRTMGTGRGRAILDPADRRRRVGEVVESGPAEVEQALVAAAAAAPGWDRVPAGERARCLERAADLLESRLGELVARCCREAGKTVSDGVAEVREAADYCRYYGARAIEGFARPQRLPGPAGELNLLSLHGRGVFACISPWNFPLAIFVGQVAAALAAGNAVVAKPAEQTPLIAAAAVALLHESGVPPECLHLLPGDGPGVGGALAADRRVAGVAFTGSFETARSINRALAARDGPIVPLIAETGGRNALVADSTALPEQLVADILESSFRSAGQRCSSLRVLCIQEEIAEPVLAMLAGAMAELRIGDPWDLATDLGPVIDALSLDRLVEQAGRLERGCRLLCRCPLPESTRHGTFFAPQVYEIDRLDRLPGEVFGPLLQVLRFRPGELGGLVDALNASGYGLTFGVHSRIEGRIERLAGLVRAGNVYANRGLIGALVGSQPFGGEGLSGTGPKAGGPHYLGRFALERALCINTAAAGGDPGLLSRGD